MDRVLQSNQFPSRQIRRVNYCRLFLHLRTVSVQPSELIWTSPSSVVSPVSSPANQQNMKSGKNVRTPPPHEKFGERLVPMQYKVRKITSTTRLLATSKRLSSPNLAISLRPFVRKSLGPHSRRLLCSQTILERPERCAIPSRRNPAHIDTFNLFFSDRCSRDSPWNHPHPWSRNYKPTSSSPEHSLRRLPFCSANMDSTPPSPP
jgi:hypothetical protein